MTFIHAAGPAALALTATAMAGPLYTAPFGPGGTWNLYKVSDESATWDAARERASTEPAPQAAGAKSHIVTFSSMAENQFVRSISGRQDGWIGLTDDERFGGHEAGSGTRDGWKWLDGGDLDFSNWKPGEPDNWKKEGTGEDAGYHDRFGRWGDVGNGFGGQVSARYRFVTEWETRSKTPVKGARAMTQVWPEGIEWPKPVKGRWSARWASGLFNTRDPYMSLPQELWRGVELLTASPSVSLREDLCGESASTQPLLWFSTPDPNRQAWLPPAKSEESSFPGLPSYDSYIGAVVGKIHVTTAGTYTIAISAEEAFALRIGDLKWKSATGDGYLDPLDPLTLTQPNTSMSSRALGVIDLPAGDHVVRALWMVEKSGTDFQVLSAPGEFRTEGATANWRPLGYVKSDKKVARLGLTDAGWNIERTESPTTPQPKMSLQDGLLKLNLDLSPITKNAVATVNFADVPATDPAHFPDAAHFPGEGGGTSGDGWALRATGRLVVPRDGTYQVGLYAQGLGALRIKGAKFVRVSQTSQASEDLHEQSDTIDFNARANWDYEPRVVTEWDLKKGEHDIEVFYVKDIGPASLAVFSSPNGPYPPALLTAGGAGLMDDVPGLPLSEN